MVASFLAAALLQVAQFQPATPPSPNQAQPKVQPQTQGETIIVNGEQPLPTTPSVARQQVNSVIATHEGQIARFFAPVCPIAIGMRPEYRGVLASRMREVAAAARIAVAPPGCHANVALIVVPNPRAFILALRSARPALFVGVETDDLNQILARRQPAVSWTSTEIINEDGFIVNPVTGVLQVRSASIISEPTRQSTVSAIVVVEERAADGKSLGQLADYAVMRAIAGAQPPSPQVGRPPSTILTLFDHDESPTEMTRFDRAYLRALYRSRANQRSMVQMAQMSRLIAQEAAREAEAEVDATPQP